MEAKMIGNKIAEARKKLTISQAQLAENLFISAQSVGKWERGESLPDITTLNRLAVILGVDLNYFSDNFKSVFTAMASEESVSNHATQSTSVEQNKPSWDLSKLNMVDSDFSGLKDLHEKFSSSNMQRCLFVGSNLSGLALHSNNIEICDFSNSDINASQFSNSNLSNNNFTNSLLQATSLFKTNINACNFSRADFSQANFKNCSFMKNILTAAKWDNTSFIETQIQDVVFEGSIKNCFFENNSFYGVKFQNATLVSTFFKNNRKIKHVEFVNCLADKVTYAFLKSNQANLAGIELLP